MSAFSDVVCVVDLSWIMRKYLYGLITEQIELSNGEKKPIGHIVGVIRTFKTLESKFQPEKIIFAEDRKTCLKQVNGMYKANRDRTGEYDIYKDLSFIERFMLTNYGKSGVEFCYANCCEADWVMFSIAKKRENNNQKTMIYTADNDLYQCLNEKRKVVIYKGSMYDWNTGKEKDLFVNILIIDSNDLMLCCSSTFDLSSCSMNAANSF